MSKISKQVQLRKVREEDLPVFFEYQKDPVANDMAAFTSKDPTDRETFKQHWKRVLEDEKVINKTILYDNNVVGHVSQFEQFGHPEVCYWIGKSYWGRGIATEALSQFLIDLPISPLYARAAKDNMASIRVLEKCGFTVIGEEKGYANARGQEIAEVILKLVR